jgi:hypothetical protein
MHIAAIRREEDPVLKTQTEPILYKQKVEEEKDGVKGAPTPSFRYYEKPQFLSEAPIDQKKEETAPLPLPDTTEEGIEAQDETGDEAETEEEAEDWWDWEEDGEDGGEESSEEDGDFEEDTETDAAEATAEAPVDAP